MHEALTGHPVLAPWSTSSRGVWCTPVTYMPNMGLDRGNRGGVRGASTVLVRVTHKCGLCLLAYLITNSNYQYSWCSLPTTVSCVYQPLQTAREGEGQKDLELCMQVCICENAYVCVGVCVFVCV